MRRLQTRPATGSQWGERRGARPAAMSGAVRGTVTHRARHTPPYPRDRQQNAPMHHKVASNSQNEGFEICWKVDISSNKEWGAVWSFQSAPGQARYRLFQSATAGIYGGPYRRRPRPTRRTPARWARPTDRRPAPPTPRTVPPTAAQGHGHTATLVHCHQTVRLSGKRNEWTGPASEPRSLLSVKSQVKRMGKSPIVNKCYLSTFEGCYQ